MPVTLHRKASISRSARAPSCRPISTTPRRRGGWRRHGTTRTSRWRRAATTRARSASSRACAATIAAGPAAEIVREAHQLAGRGVKELLLISQDTTFYGNDLGERGALAPAAARAEPRGRPRVDPAALPLSDDHRRHDARRDGRVRQGLQVHRPAAAARLRRRAEAHEAARHAQELRAAARPTSGPACPAPPCARPSSSASPARPRPTSPSSRDSSTRVRFDHVGVFTYSHEEGTRGRRVGRRRAGGDEAEAPRPADGAAAGDRRGGAAGAASAAASGWSSTARRPSTSSSCAAVWRPRRPTSTRSSTSPTATPPTLAAGQFLEAEVVGARDYDLVARPLL